MTKTARILVLFLVIVLSVSMLFACSSENNVGMNGDASDGENDNLSNVGGTVIPGTDGETDISGDGDSTDNSGDNADTDHTHTLVTVQGYAATCTEDGLTDGEMCKDCGAVTAAQQIIAASGHTYTSAVTDPTCTSQGYTEYTCACGYSYIGDYLCELGHSYEDGFCTLCGDEEPPAYIRVNAEGAEDPSGEYILFGTYPQSEVTDISLTAVLTDLAGEIPTSSNSYDWTSYGYYISSSDAVDYMWYIDVQYAGNTYRGVYFVSYRPYYTSSSSYPEYSRQYGNGYSSGTVYWFEHEPIEWRVLTESDGRAFLLCEMIIDSQEYYHSLSDRTINGDTVYANNYEHSGIRAWLNDTFYNTAFTDLQKQMIDLITVDNSALSTTDAGGNIEQATNYACNDTQDMIFLLSEKEVTASEYGFASCYTSDKARQKVTTAYARCQGVYTDTNPESYYYGCGAWLLRSPSSYSFDSSWLADVDGYAGVSGNTNYTDYGICPALWITL